MFELPEELKEKYKYIELASPEHIDYKAYLKATTTKNPVTMYQFIDVASFITAVMIPKRLNLTEEERELINRYHLQNRALKVFDMISQISDK